MSLRSQVLVLLGAVACSSAPSKPADSDAERIAALRFRIATDPDDRQAHRELARLFGEAGKPGAALRHWAAAGSAIAKAERREVARLYLARAERRLALGDLYAYTDLEAVDDLGLSPLSLDRDLTRRAMYAAALAAYRRADEPGRRDGARLLARTERIFGPDPRQAAASPDDSPVVALGAAAAWLADGNARRVARELYLRYASRGGNAPVHRARAIELERWWRGSAAMTPLGESALDDPCALAYAPADLDCARILADELASPAVFERASHLGWRLRGGRAAAALLPAALENWLAGDAAGWLDDVARVIELESIDAAEIAAAPAWARPSLWRMTGDRERAARAVETALTGDEPIGGRAAAVVLIEAALAGQPIARLRRLASGASGWRALARVARARRLAGSAPASVERELLAAAAATAREAHHRALVDLGPLAALGDDLAVSAIARLTRAAPALARRAADGWRAIGWSGQRPRSAVEVVALGGVDPARLAADVGLRDQVGALSRIARAHARDPALADRLARDWIDGAVSALERGPAVIELFRRAGDPRRADRAARRLLAESSEHPGSLIAAAETAAAVGDGRRAVVLMILAAARSGDAGATARRGTRSFLESGATAAALRAGRWALPLTPPGDDLELLELLARAMLRLGRRADAADALDRLERRVGSPDRSARIRAAGGGATRTPDRGPLSDPIAAAAWSPGHPETLAAALEVDNAPPWIEAQLAAVALGADTDRARRAMRLWARRAAPPLAEALEREADRLPR